jgi:glyoxylase-like metal-dependent hydrolase (beta-lactamase superfamily II)
MALETLRAFTPPSALEHHNGRMTAPAANLPDFVEALGHGIYAIDTGFQRPRFDAAYLLIDGGHAAVIDTGTNHAVPRILAALNALGLAREAVSAVIPTHVHLDHAGGAGLLMRELPSATLWVHPRGARHMVNPMALVAGALEVYCEQEMQRSYGTVLPVDEQRVSTTHDGQNLRIGSRTLHFIDTPGHAKHHHCIWDATAKAWFSGDTFGLSYREFDTAAGSWGLPTTTPVQFEPDALRASIERMLTFEPERIFLTHYGCVNDAQRQGRQVLALLDAMQALGLRLKNHPNRHTALKSDLAALYASSLRNNGIEPSPERMAALAVDIELNAQGMAFWLDR